MNNKYYVYMFINWDWNAPFYIGKGSNNRYKELKGRSDQIIEIFKRHNCTSHIINYYNTEEDALKAERNYKRFYKNRGEPIIDNERDSDKNRQREGIERAKSEGKYIGRKPVDMPIDFPIIYKSWKHGDITATNAMSQLGLKKTTFYKMVNNFESA